MARTNTATKSKAGKDIHCRKCGAKIEPGETYYHYSLRPTGRGQGRRYTHCFRHPPRQSDKTSSKMYGVYAAVESAEDAIASAQQSGDVSSLPDALRDCASEVETVKDEYQESIDNMPENLQNGGVADEIREKIDALEEFASALESAADDLDSMDIISQGEPGEDDEEPERDDFPEGEAGAQEFEDAVKEYQDKKTERENEVEEAISKAQDVLGELSL